MLTCQLMIAFIFINSCVLDLDLYNAAPHINQIKTAVYINLLFYLKVFNLLTNL